LEPTIPSQYLALQLLDPTHTSEIPLTFRQLTNLPIPNGTCSLDAQEVQISDVLTAAWSSMGVSGTPGAGAGILGGPWPQYNSTASLGLLITNKTSVGVVNYTLCDFWDQIAAAEVNITMTPTSNSPSASNSSSSSGSNTTSGSPAISTTNDEEKITSRASFTDDRLRRFCIRPCYLGHVTPTNQRASNNLKLSELTTDNTETALIGSSHFPSLPNFTSILKIYVVYTPSNDKFTCATNLIQLKTFPSRLSNWVSLIQIRSQTRLQVKRRRSGRLSIFEEQSLREPDNLEDALQVFFDTSSSPN
jgi:hypothetical protein